MLFSVSPSDSPKVVQLWPTFLTTVTLVFSAGVADSVISLVFVSNVNPATVVVSPCGLSSATVASNTSSGALRKRIPAANTSISSIDPTAYPISNVADIPSAVSLYVNV